MATKRAISVSELIATRFDELDFTGEYYDLIGKPELAGAWIIWGNSFNGKTRFAIKLCKYLAQFGKVIYNSIEEGCCKSTRDAFIDEGLEEVKRRVVLLDKEPIEELTERLSKKRSAKIIFIDSLQYTGLNSERYKKLVSSFPNKLFVFVSHAQGKNPKGTVAESVRYDAFVKIWVEGYRAFAMSRYGGGKPFTIWEKGAREYWGEDFKTA